MAKAPAPKKAAAPKRPRKTVAQQAAAQKGPRPSYRANERGYVDGQLIEPGQVFSSAGFKGSWAEPLTEKDAAMARAAEQALDPQPDDVEIQGLSRPALEAMAAERGIDPKNLDDDQLVDAIKAARDR